MCFDTSTRWCDCMKGRGDKCRDGLSAGRPAQPCRPHLGTVGPRRQHRRPLPAAGYGAAAGQHRRAATAVPASAGAGLPDTDCAGAARIGGAAFDTGAAAPGRGQPGRDGDVHLAGTGRDQPPARQQKWACSTTSFSSIAVNSVQPGYAVASFVWRALSIHQRLLQNEACAP